MAGRTKEHTPAWVAKRIITKETLVLTDAGRDAIADRLARETKARVKESRRLIEASKRIRKR